jgi:hypothetical protein
LTIEEYEQNEVVVVAKHFLTSTAGFESFSEVLYGFLTIFDEIIQVSVQLAVFQVT